MQHPLQHSLLLVRCQPRAMKKYILLPLLGLSLITCKKGEEEPRIPETVTAAFDQDVDLRYRQQALVPTANQPELTVQLTDLSYSFCPKNVRCFIADFVWPTVKITDAQGQVQELRQLGKVVHTYNPAWTDTASVRANGRRYVVQYTRYNLDEYSREEPQKEDITVTIRITKPN